ncbi:hypothetical protein ACFVIN_35010 [Streptomyces prasinus]|uniref:hypothetical protein n=1 Tax=Streptomyces prasinus TaxID=67345 RepID=UPI003629BD4C
MTGGTAHVIADDAEALAVAADLAEEFRVEASARPPPHRRHRARLGPRPPARRRAAPPPPAAPRGGRRTAEGAGGTEGDRSP